MLQEAAAGELGLCPPSKVCKGKVFYRASRKLLQVTAVLFITQALLHGTDFTLTFKKREVVASRC